jgi:BirA family biotin operon repressor/biotin-[acetyl-CoA-carboxylase] ligase
MELGAEAARIEHLVLGIGVNLNVDRETFPEEFRELATSLASHAGRKIDRIAFTRQLYTSLEEVLDACAEGGFEAVRSRFDERFRMRGRRITVSQMDGRESSGTAIGIDGDGALRLRTDDGVERRVIAGDVTIAKDSPPTDGAFRRPNEA